MMFEQMEFVSPEGLRLDGRRPMEVFFYLSIFFYIEFYVFSFILWVN
jgi:hypothetical protein